MMHALKIWLILTCAWLPRAHAELPEPVNAALQKIGLPANQVSVFVQPLADQPAQLDPPLISHQAQTGLNPASNMKLLTSYAGLALLGPAYRWKTEVYADGNQINGVLYGNLYFKGYGDPKLSIEDFWRMLSSLRQQGLKEIRGDLIVDNSYFASQALSAGSFDGEANRAYNATPSAFAVNAATSSFRFDGDDSRVAITVEPNLPKIRVLNQLKVTNGDCNAWKSNLQYEVVVNEADGALVTFSGSYPVNCKEKYLELLVLDKDHYHLQLFDRLWRELGGEFNGKLSLKTVPPQAHKILQHDSETLAQTLVDMNKWSNNFMARQLLLTIAAEKHSLPATEAKGAQAVKLWLSQAGIEFDELVIDNGSGLSRVERISAEHLGSMLVQAYYSPVMPELMASLPVLGTDGTVQRRMRDHRAQGRAHLKTGSIQSVYTIAGYVLADNGQRYVVVFMVNHAKSGQTRLAQDALLEWVYAH